MFPGLDLYNAGPAQHLSNLWVLIDSTFKSAWSRLRISEGGGYQVNQKLVGAVGCVSTGFPTRSSRGRGDLIKDSKKSLGRSQKNPAPSTPIVEKKTDGGLISFCFVFSYPIYYLRPTPASSHRYIRSTIGSHSGRSPPLPTTVQAFMLIAGSWLGINSMEQEWTNLGSG